MKKRILILALAIVCLFSFASCKKDTPQSLFENAEKVLAEANGYTATATIITSSDVSGTKNTTEFEMEMKANGDNFEITVDGQTVLYVDGIVYMDMGELGKIKTEMSKEDLASNLNMNTDATKLPSFDEKDFQDVELISEGDLRSFTVLLDEETIQEFLGDMLSDYSDADAEISFSDMSFTASFDKNDKLVSTLIQYTMVLNMGDLGEMKMETQTLIEFTDLGGALPTITAPSDADEYVEQNM